MRLSFPKLFGSILGFVLVGTPLVAYVWETLNQLMAGHFNGRRVAIGAVAALVLAALLRFLARSVWRWEETREAMPEAPSSGRIP
jgi:hypothetical protein